MKAALNEQCSTRVVAGEGLKPGEIVSLYEAGSVIHVDGMLADAPFELFSKIRPEYSRDIKKVGTGAWIKGKAVVARYLKEAFEPDGEVAEFQDALQDVIARLMAWSKVTFRGYRIERAKHTFRPTHSTSEGLHYDIYDPKPHHARVFVNLSEKDRVWRVGPRIDEAMEILRDVVEMDQRMGADGVAKKLSQYLELNPEALPTHTVEFAPGDVWSANTQIVGHEIVDGDCAVCAGLVVEPDSMYNPKLLFRRIVKRQFAKWAHVNLP